MLVGRTTQDPQLRKTAGGTSVAAFSIATNRTWKDKDGTKKEEVEFHNIVAWGRTAEIAAQWLKKGAMVYIEGRLQTRSWQDKQGATRKTTEIICENLQLGPKPSGAPSAPKKDEFNDEIPVIELEDDIKPEDLPF